MQNSNFSDEFSNLIDNLEADIISASMIAKTSEDVSTDKSKMHMNESRGNRQNGAKIARQIESDVARLRCRQNQINLGKNTQGYRNYILKYPQKTFRPKDGPKTPRKDQICSKRSWDGQLKNWRRLLHEYDKI